MWFDLQTDFYRPLWIRLCIVAVCFGWAGFEFFTGGGLWAALFAFLGAVALQQFFLDGWPASEDSLVEASSDEIEKHNNELASTTTTRSKKSDDDKTNDKTNNKTNDKTNDKTNNKTNNKTNDKNYSETNHETLD